MELPQIFDTIIIGGGPAGLSATIYAVRKNLKVLLVTKDIGGQAALSGDIENYLGYTLISGADLAIKFRTEVEQFKNEGLWLEEGEIVSGISGNEGSFQVKTESGKNFFGKTLIIASGRTPKLLGIPGEKEFLGKGVANCATCDAPLFKDRDVAVVGGGNSALDAVTSLVKIAKSITIINNSQDLRGDSVMLANVKNATNVKIINNAEVLEILGDQAVGGLKIRDQAAGEQTLVVNGVFVEIGWTPSSSFDKLTKKNERGEIIVDEFGKTSVDGIWAAGDVNSLWGEQIVIAAGEGAKVALVVAEHLARLPHQVTSNPHES